MTTPKHNARWPHIEPASDEWGKPKSFIIDNKLDQTGKSYQAPCEDGKIVKLATVKRPQHKAVVERFFLTLKQ